MRPPWMDPDAPGPTALCVTNEDAREAHQWASDVPGGPQQYAVLAAHEEARYWCNRCDVANECLPFALTAEGRTDERARDGVYGAVGPEGRATLAGRGPKTPKRLDPIPCEGCGEDFTPTHVNRYCSAGCKRTFVNRRQNVQRKNKRALARAGVKV